MQNYNAEVGTFATVTPELGIVQSGGSVGIGTRTPSELLHLVSSTASKPILRLENTNADASPAFLDFSKNSASAADDDTLGQIRFKGKDSIGSETTYVDLYCQ